MDPNRQILENLLQSAKDPRLWQRFTFQHDNDLKHAAKETLEWLLNKNVKSLNGPAKADLNPIENLWKDLKIDIHRCSPFKTDRASANLQGRMGENPKIQMCKAHTDIPKKTRN